MVVLQVHGGGARGRDRSDDGAYAMVDTTAKSKEGRLLTALTILVILCEQIRPVGPRVAAGSLPP